MSTKKLQIIGNIGGGGSGNNVRYDTAQELTKDQKATARDNIDAITIEDVYKTETQLRFTWDGEIENRDVVDVNGAAFYKVSDTVPDFNSINSAISTLTDTPEECAYLREYTNCYEAGTALIITQAGSCVYGNDLMDEQVPFTAPSTGIYFYCDGYGYQDSLTLNVKGATTLTYTWDGVTGSEDRMDRFLWNGWFYYKVSSENVLDFFSIDSVVSKLSDGRKSTTLIRGINCYLAGHSIVVTQPGSCALYNMAFIAPSAGIYFNYFSDDKYQTYLMLSANGKCGVYINSTTAKTFIIGVTDEGIITTEDRTGAIVEMATNAYIDEHMVTTNESISNLSVLIGDEPVSTQISNAVATKIDTPESAEVGQVLSVKSVDNNGKITWEAVNPELVEGNVTTDPTFSEEGSAADAKLTGDRLGAIESQIADWMPVCLSRAEYEALVAEGKVNSTTPYLIREEVVK